jgi:hypothetical protein
MAIDGLRGCMVYVDDVSCDLNPSDNNVTACHYSDGRLSEDPSPTPMT